MHTGFWLKTSEGKKELILRNRLQLEDSNETEEWRELVKFADMRSANRTAKKESDPKSMSVLLSQNLIQTACQYCCHII
jgi:hypothetical protein